MQEVFKTKVTFKTIENGLNKSDSAIREAIANAIDAKSKNIYLDLYSEKAHNSVVDVSYFCLDIADDGEGIPTDKNEFEKVFCRYNDSDKKEKFNYGKRGKGRYTYLLLPHSPDGVYIYTKKLDSCFQINFNCKENETLAITHEPCNYVKINTPIKSNYTTLIQFKNLNIKKFEGIKNNEKEEYLRAIKNEILTFFVDRIASESINIYLNNELLKIDDYLEQSMVSETIKIIEDADISTFEVNFYIWNKSVKLKSDRQKHILFFDKENYLKGIAPSGKNKLAFNGVSFDHTVIVKSNYFQNRDFIYESDEYENLLTDKIVKKLRRKIAYKLEEILFQIYKKNINKVSDEYIHFLKLSEDEITQKVFHTLFLPFVEKFGNKKISADVKSIIAKLIETLANESPDSFIKNLKTILNLTKEESKKVQYIQENYGIIKAITEKEEIIKRIDFLNNFDDLVNGQNRKNVQERTQLHYVIDKNLWLIDKEFEGITYSDIVSDKALQTILENENFYQFNSNELAEILSTHDVAKIPDIFIPIEKNNIIYVIELKKPTQQINNAIINEVMEKYVKTLKSINKKYEKSNQKKILGIAISDTKTENAYPVGNLDTVGVQVEPKCWSELIELARERCNKRIQDLDNKLKISHWKDLDDLILSHGGKV